ncbi:MAG: thioredoxin family protein [Candidatus Dormibacteraeota bacterium]|nr:thioredoxin family protein [Candidatus Dormibacteraeota bacterium]
MLHGILLTVPDCHLCTSAREAVHRAAGAGRVQLEEIAWDSRQGRRLVERDGVLFAPALYIDDRLVGYGQISEGTVRNWLKKRTAS